MTANAILNPFRRKMIAARWIAAAPVLIGWALAPSAAEAAFTHLSLVPHATVQTPQGPRQVLRLYAHFSDPHDQLLAWGGDQQFPALFKTMLCNSQTGGNFYNPGGNTAPTQEAIDDFPSLQWDTFATIGVSIADHGSVPPPGYPDATLVIGIGNFISGNQLTITQGAVIASADAQQTYANYAGDGDPELRVLMAQFTVRMDDAIWGSNVGFLTFKSGGSSQTIYNLPINILAAFGTCCIEDGCHNASQASCAFAGGTYLGCQPCTSCPPPKPPCVGDVSPSGGDGQVNVQDMLAVINAWGACPAPCPADLNEDGTVNVADLLGVINAWGPCE